MTDLITVAQPVIAELSSEARDGASEIVVSKPAPEGLWLGTFKAMLWDQETLTHITVLKGAMGRVWTTTTLSRDFSPGVQIVRERIPLHLAGPDAPPWQYNPDDLPAGTFLFANTVARTSWVVPHNLHGFPGLTVQHDVGEEVECIVDYASPDILTLAFSAPAAGQVFCDLARTN